MSEKVPKRVLERSEKVPERSISVVKCSAGSNSPETLRPDWFNLHFYPFLRGLRHGAGLLLRISWGINDKIGLKSLQK